MLRLGQKIGPRILKREKWIYSIFKMSKIKLFVESLDKTKTLEAESGGSITLGRNQESGVVDKRCSRKHTLISYDATSSELVIKQLGSNKGCIQTGGAIKELAQHSVQRIPCESEDEDRFCELYLLSSPKKHGFKVRVEKPINNKDTDVKSSTPKKRKMDGTLNGFVMTKRPKAEINGDTDALSSGGEWNDVDKWTWFNCSTSVKPSNKIAAFDMDHTLILPKSGAKWPKGKDDWKWLFPSIINKLRQLHADGYKIVIITNQAGIMKGTQKASDIKHKMDALRSELKIPVMCIISGSKLGKYRKPCTGMWDIVVNNNEGVKISLNDSFYIGDAAGRQAKWASGKKKDFSCGDRLFALNIGLPFQTPEEYFLSWKPAAYNLPEFNPKSILDPKPQLEPPNAKLPSAKKELIIMVGFPGSGKSTFSKSVAGYVRANRDELQTWQKCVAKADETLKSGKSIIIDNTNPDRDSRKRYIDIAKKHNVPIRCFQMSTSYHHSKHNEKFRQLTQPAHKPISDMIYNMYKSKYEQPSLEEGFTEIVTVNLKPQFESDDTKKLYCSYIVD